MNKIKLNLGAGADHIDGWINADIDPSTNPDQIVDLEERLPYKENQVEEVLLYDVLEHFTKQKAESILGEVHRILKKGGSLYIRLPNVLEIINKFGYDEEVMMEFLYGTTTHNGDWGAHKFGYTKKSISKLLKRIGFGNITVNSETTNYKISCQKIVRENKNLNILVINQSPDWGGAEEWINTLVNLWQKNGIKIHGVTNNSQLLSSWEDSKATTTKLPFILDIIGNYKGLLKSVLLLPYAIYWYARLLISHKQADVVVMSGFSEKLLVTHLAKMIGIPVIWFEYGPLEPVFKKNIYLPKVLYRLTKYIPKRVITISNNSKLSLLTSGRVSLSKLRVISPGVYIPNKEILTKKKGYTVGHISRLTSEKGQRLLLKAFKQVLLSFPNAKLKIAGRGPDEATLKNYVKSNNLEKNVEFLGFISDKESFYKSIDIFVFASTWDMEGFGLVNAEALSYGLPVVTTNNGPAAEIISQKTGILVGKTPASMAKGIINVLSSQQSFSKIAYKYAKQHYNAKIQADKVLGEIRDVVYENN